MPRMQCRACDNAGVILKKKQKKNPDGTTSTEEVRETCPTCKGAGWVETPGG